LQPGFSRQQIDALLDEHLVERNIQRVVSQM
jgi:hypothetical protein